MFSLEDHVPAEHPLCRVDAPLDLSVVCDGMAKHYSSVGRPLINPGFMIRMLLIS